MKVVVYAICKNEEQFVDRWVSSMKEADEIYVLDTGSTDNTIDELKKRGVIVKKKSIVPWRFDKARNESLSLVPKNTDICVCTDLDEVFLPGWRSELEKIWKKDINRISYNYNWSLDGNNKPLVNFYIEKIHSYGNYTWTHPVHEVLTFLKAKENKIVVDNITLNHYPDSTKSRNNYLPLLEMSVKEDPCDDRNMHYLGREYMYHKKYNEAIDTLIRHLNLKRATWKDERAASMRFIGRCYSTMKRYDESIMWYKKAIKEAPYLRDGYVELASLYSMLEDYNKVIYYTNKALKIKIKYKNYINELFSWNDTIYDLRSIAFYYIGKYKASLANSSKAMELNSDDERLKENNTIIKNKIKETTNK